MLHHDTRYCRDVDLDPIEEAIQRTQRRRRKADQRSKAAFAALPTDEMSAETQQRLESELDVILADLRRGKLDTLVTFSEADHEALENEHPGASLIGSAL